MAYNLSGIITPPGNGWSWLSLIQDYINSVPSSSSTCSLHRYPLLYSSMPNGTVDILELNAFYTLHLYSIMFPG